MNILGIIPSRYASSRFPGKPLEMLGEKTIVQRVYERASSAIDDVCVATDDERIMACVEGFGGVSVMTSANHKSGTDRCFEALLIMEKRTGRRYDIIINIQGDEPFIEPSQISQLISQFDDSATQIATLGKIISDFSDIFDPNKPKIALDKKDFALLFSRSPIPYIRGLDKDKWPGEHRFIKHIGIYAFRSEILEKLTQLAPGSLETAESLEQLRWLENGYRIKVGMTVYENIGIDTPEDLEKAKGKLGKRDFR